METILIIEDNKDIRESCAEILELSGYNVLQADDGNRGIDLAFKLKPDLILCDIIMSPVDGYEVLKTLQENINAAKIPFIFLSSKTDRSDFRKAMDMGVDDYITKPFTDSELLSAIQTRIKAKVYKNDLTPPLLKIGDAIIPNSSGMEELYRFIKQQPIRTVKKKQVLYYEGDSPKGLYLLIKGCVKTTRFSPDGEEYVTGLYLSDDCFAIKSLLANEPLTETAEAVIDSSFHLLSANSVFELSNRYPNISQCLTKMLFCAIHDKEEQLLGLAYHSASKRLAQVLIRLYQNFSPNSVISISRDELAALAGIASETVSRTLSDFKSQGLIKKNGGHIQILNMDGLLSIKNHKL